MTELMAGTVAIFLLVTVLVATIAYRTRQLAVATLAAAIAILAGLISPEAAASEARGLAPTLAFLAAILLLGALADSAGVFGWLGRWLEAASKGRPRRLFALVFASAASTTAALSLDATVVLLTPVVLVTALRARISHRPHIYACGHLANSASCLLPVSNLTNLLAFSATGLTFAGFTALMVAPWLAAIAVEYAVLRWWFRRELPSAGPTPEHVREPAPRFALVVLALTLAGFAASGPLEVYPAWLAAGGALALSARALTRRTVTPLDLVRAASPQFCAYVLALAVVVAALGEAGLTGALDHVVPDEATLSGMLLTAGIAAVLANVVNNIPATLLLLAVLGTGAPTGLILAMVLGLNIGPNLTYPGSLATLLWRQVLSDHDRAPSLREFTVLGLLSVPPALVTAVLALWWVL